MGAAGIGQKSDGQLVANRLILERARELSKDIAA